MLDGESSVSAADDRSEGRAAQLALDYFQAMETIIEKNPLGK